MSNKLYVIHCTSYASYEYVEGYVVSKAYISKERACMTAIRESLMTLTNGYNGKVLKGLCSLFEITCSKEEDKEEEIYHKIVSNTKPIAVNRKYNEVHDTLFEVFSNIAEKNMKEKLVMLNKYFTDLSTCTVAKVVKLNVE